MFRQNAGSNMCGPKTSKVPTSILSTNVHRCTYLSRSLFVTPSTVDRRQQTQAFLDSALRMRRRSNYRRVNFLKLLSAHFWQTKYIKICKQGLPIYTMIKISKYLISYKRRQVSTVYRRLIMTLDNFSIHSLYFQRKQ